MFNIIRKEIQWGDSKISLETGKVARQADGAVIVSSGNTQVLCTVVAKKAADPNVDFFPLGVHYQEKLYAAGRIPGGFLKRENRPTEKETLTSRLIDRPIRPLFPESFRNETQVICTVLSYDPSFDPDVLAMIGASAALTISGIPFLGPIAGARVGYKDGKYLLNPTGTDLEDSELNLVVAGTSEGVLMVESEAAGLSEEIMLGAVTFGHDAMQCVIEGIIDFAEEAAKDPWELDDTGEQVAAFKKIIQETVEADLRAAYKVQEKMERRTLIDAAKEKAQAQVQEVVGEEIYSDTFFLMAFKKAESDIVRKDILKTGLRIDGRDTKTVRPIECEVGFLATAHGSALFTRGETQAIVATTLGTGEDEQIMEDIQGESKERFLLHYNFPPFSVGETGRLGAPGRREIGHGKLAWRALKRKLPSAEQFPYTLRTVSEITESNGSSSMATVCGTSLALMDAGVPLEKPIAGIAMGLIKEGKDFMVLSDILGDEDHLGDMDFKVAGTDEGITALQMDLKIASINKDIMQQALAQAKDGRLHILKEMQKAIHTSRDVVKDHAPRIASLTIPKDKIRDVIGTGGKIIRELCETYEVKIDIEDDGSVRVYGTASKNVDDAMEKIKSLTTDAEIGGVYTGKVVKIVEFGAFVDFLSTSGLVHVSEISTKRVEKVTDVLAEGDTVQVKVIGVDPKTKKVRLSMKALLVDDAGEQKETGDDGDKKSSKKPAKKPAQKTDADTASKE
jgi:polyribonucleotide nucleotidyltransferase